MSIALTEKVAELEKRVESIAAQLRADTEACIFRDEAAAMKRLEAYFGNVFMRKPGPKKEQNNG